MQNYFFNFNVMCDSECCGEDCCIFQVGSPAPNFKMEGYYKGEKQWYSLEDFKDKWTILFFYPLDFTFVCPTELIELSKKHDEFEKENCQVLGVSVDSVFSHEAWSKELGDLNYPLLSDITKEVSFDYGVLLADKGISLRGAFLISPDGVLKGSIVNDLDVGRNVDELLRLIKALKTGELCPVNWTPEKKTLGKG